MAGALRGLRVVITRAEQQAASLAERLRALGAEPLFFPTIAFKAPDDLAPFDRALAQIESYDWLVLTSATTVDFVARRLGENPDLKRRFQQASARLRVAAVGPATAAACRRLLGLDVERVPERFIAESLAEALGDLHDQRIVLFNADLAHARLEALLREAGAQVERVIAYHTVPASGGVDLEHRLRVGEVDAITFASGSAGRFFVQRLSETALAIANQKLIVAIGPTTADDLRAVGIEATVVASTFTEEGMLAALLSSIENKNEV
jgi:uroporphyrinogen-III synthase